MTIKFLGENGRDTEFDVGDTIRIESTIEQQRPFEDTWSLTDPNTVTITIIEDYNNTKIVEEVDMTKDSTGQYFYNWNTTNLDPADYEVIVDGSTNGAKESEDDYIRLTD